MNQKAKYGAGFLICLILILLYARYVEPQRIVVEKVALSSAKFPKDFYLRIAHISDLHMQTLGPREAKVIRRVNNLHPDLILITGDLLSTTLIFNNSEALHAALQHVQTFIEALQARYGVYVCRGNNDMSDDKEVGNGFVAALSRAGATLLSDRSEMLTVGAERIALMGVDYPELFYEESNDFWVNVENNNHVLQSGVSKDNSYSHYYDVAFRWSTFQMTGRMRRTGAKEGGIGVVFYSQFNTGYDRYYRLRGSDLAPFLLSPHGTKLSGGRDRTTLSPQTNVWYRFKVQVETLADRTVMRARVWPQEENEPDFWQCDAFDTSATRLTGGTVGLWSSRSGAHQFDDVCVTSLMSGDTLLFEDFESTPKGQDPFGWVDYNFSAEAIPLMKKYVPDSCYSILLAHTPDFVRMAQQNGIDLVLSGHTHGGQVRLPLIGPLTTRIALGPRYTAGLFHFGKTTLYVNRGIGTILLPWRFMCPPEITLIELGNRASGESRNERGE